MLVELTSELISGREIEVKIAIVGAKNENAAPCTIGSLQKIFLNK